MYGIYIVQLSRGSSRGDCTDPMSKNGLCCRRRKQLMTSLSLSLPLVPCMIAESMLHSTRILKRKNNFHFEKNIEDSVPKAMLS